jgi:hypothetical protein
MPPRFGDGVDVEIRLWIARLEDDITRTTLIVTGREASYYTALQAFQQSPPRTDDGAAKVYLMQWQFRKAQLDLTTLQRHCQAAKRLLDRRPSDGLGERLSQSFQPCVLGILAAVRLTACQRRCWYSSARAASGSFASRLGARFRVLATSGLSA